MASRSRIGTTIGGWLTIRYFPSTRSPSLDSACRLSWVCALAAAFSAFFSARLAALVCFLVLAALAAWRIACSISSSVRCAYQTSKRPISAKPAIASR